MKGPVERDGRRQLVKLVVYVLLERNGRILLGKRRGAFGEGYYSMPAGHVENGETVLGCAKRELHEETGVKARRFEFMCVRLLKPYKIGGVRADPYVAFCVQAEDWRGEPRVTEPERTFGWEWHSVKRLPEPLFPPIGMLMKCIGNCDPFMD